MIIVTLTFDDRDQSWPYSHPTLARHSARYQTPARHLSRSCLPSSPRHPAPIYYPAPAPALYLLPTIAAPGFLLLFPLNCSCGGSARGGGVRGGVLRRRGVRRGGVRRRGVRRVGVRRG